MKPKHHQSATASAGVELQQRVKKRMTQRTRRPVRLGVLKGHIVVPEDFDVPLPESVLDGFEGNQDTSRRR